MRILILSDSHHGMNFMEECAFWLKPDCILHLGDYYADGFDLKQEFPKAEFYQVPGNCDAYGCSPDKPLILMPKIGGLNIYMTHGHRHNVKLTTALLLRDARNCGADIVLYGHTHIPECYQEKDGLWVMNPGSAGYGPTAGLLEIENGKVIQAKILTDSNLEGLA